MGKKQQNAQKMKKRYCEALRLVQDSEENNAWLGSSGRRAPEPNRPFLLATLRELIDRENISEAASDELLRGNVVLRGDGRTFRSSPHIPYIHYHQFVPDLLHLQMRVSQRQLSCLWCEQDNAEQE
jgi:hypothetical protein